MTKDKMSYDEFKSKLKENLLKLYLGIKISEIEEVRRNDIKKDALLVRIEGNRICPTVYFDKLYDSYKAGESIDSITAKTAEEIKVAADTPEVSALVKKLMSFEAVKSNIRIRVLNTKTNQNYLKHIIHRDVLDLSMVFSVVYPGTLSNKGQYSVDLRQEMLDKWNISIEQLYEIAVTNTKNDFVCRGITTIINETQGKFNLEEDKNEIMYVLTNRQCINGAGLIFVPGVLSACSEKIAGGGDLFVLPSSIHESILIKADFEMHTNLSNLVTEINSTIVKQSEVLSNNIYYYNSKLDQVILTK